LDEVFVRDLALAEDLVLLKDPTLEEQPRPLPLAMVEVYQVASVNSEIHSVVAV